MGCMGISYNIPKAIFELFEATIGGTQRGGCSREPIRKELLGLPVYEFGFRVQGLGLMSTTYLGAPKAL